MRKILVKQIVVDYLYAIFLFIVSVVIFSVLNWLLGENEPMTLAEMNESDGLDLMVIFYLMLFQERACRLPDAVFLVPISREKRIQMVKTLFMDVWIGCGVFVWIIVNMNGILTLLTAGDWGVFLCIEKLVQFGVLLSSAYLLCYVGYFSRKDELISLACWFVPCIQFGFYAILGEAILEDGLKGIIIMGSIGAVFWIINGWFHKKYFNEMVDFYADYESSRKLVEKKVSA